MTNVPLGEVVEILSGHAFKSNQFNTDGLGMPIIRIRDVGKAESKTFYTGQFGEKYLIQAGDLLIGMDGDFRLAEWNGPVSLLNQRVCRIAPSTKAVIKSYLKHFLPAKLQAIEDRTSYATVKHLSAKKIRAIEIPLPPLEEQRRIVEILDAAQALIDQRKEQLGLMDQLVQSLFYEMFGDPVTNPMGWEAALLGAHGSFKNGLNFKKSETGYTIRCLGVGDFKNRSTISDVTTLPEISLSSEPNNDYFLENKDLVFVRSNGNGKLVGRCVLILGNSLEPTSFSGFCIRLRLNSGKLLAVYLNHLSRIPSFREQMLSRGRGANIQNTNQKILSSLSVPLPPLEFQTQFAERVEAIEEQKAAMAASLVELETTFQALMQRAFKGELTG